MLASVLAIVIGKGAYSLNEGPRRRVPEEGKGPGGAERAQAQAQGTLLAGEKLPGTQEQKRQA